MTIQDDERFVPNIADDNQEDVPIAPEALSGASMAPYWEAASLGKTESLDDQITKFKYLTGKRVLYIAMGAMGLSVLTSIVLAAFDIESALLINAFEVFKLIAMTVLGYIFGSQGSK